MATKGTGLPGITPVPFVVVGRSWRFIPGKRYGTAISVGSGEERMKNFLMSLLGFMLLAILQILSVLTALLLWVVYFGGT